MTGTDAKAWTIFVSGRLDLFLMNDEASFLRLVLDCVSDCLVVVDTDGLIVLINQPYCDLLGGVPKDFIGRSVHDVISPQSQLPLVARGGKPLVADLLKVRGQEIVTKQVPIWLDGEIVGALGMALFPSTQVARGALRALSGGSLVLSGDGGQWQARYGLDDIVGRGPEMLALKAAIRQAGRTRLPLLVEGETGVGKELVAQATHRVSMRAGKPFVWVNCATIPADLVASELFGYEPGAFTGSNAKGAKGKLELAHEGTIFLDEIGDMPLSAQAALLRFLQEGEITRVGGSRPIRIDVRVISASHKNLEAMVDAGEFRQDLLYRLRVLDIAVPPLRARSDLDLLVSHLIARTQIELGLPRLSLSTNAIEQLRSYSWPGNVRELVSAIQRGAAALPEGAFQIETFDGLHKATSPECSEIGGRSLASVVATAERQAIVDALVATEGNRTAAARRLGIDRSSFYKRLREYGLDKADA